MVRQAIDAHEAFEDCNLSVFAKGSYANNTNVRADSDVDIAVQCHEALYYDEEAPGDDPTPPNPYRGIWTPAKLRAEIGVALEAKFPGQVDASGSTAFQVNASTARVDADVVPCFDYRYYFAGGHEDGNRVIKTTGNSVENWPAQQLTNGRAKNNRTSNRFKQAVRILKRVENAMVAADEHRVVPSFFVECLVYNCPDAVLLRPSWTARIEGVLVHIWDELQGDAEPLAEQARWLEVNERKYLFHATQKWTRADGRDFAQAAWNHLGMGE